MGVCEVSNQIQAAARTIGYDFKQRHGFLRLEQSSGITKDEITSYFDDISERKVEQVAVYVGEMRGDVYVKQADKWITLAS